jgi:endo-1,4-beta-xylanase
MDVLYSPSCPRLSKAVPIPPFMRVNICCVAMFLLLMSFAPPAQGQTLRQAADQSGLLIGTAVRAEHLAEPAYASALAKQFNMLEAEDAMKWWVLRPAQNRYDFRQADELVRFAHAHQMKVRGHCLVWGRNNPDWLAQGHFTEQQLSSLLHEHITRVMKHYAGRVFAWDVVNEALDENGNLRDSVWYNQPGVGFSQQATRFIEQSFRWAHKADPKALLFYNDAEGEGMNRKSDAIYAMAQEFKRRGVPIDGIGLQMHIPNLEVDPASLTANIERLGSLGLQVHITELDVSLPIDSNGQVRAEDLSRQAEIYRTILRACLNSKRCTAVQTWGFTDKYSWIGSHSRGARGQALLFDRVYEPKPAFHTLLEELSLGRNH